MARSGITLWMWTAGSSGGIAEIAKGDETLSRATCHPLFGAIGMRMADATRSALAEALPFHDCATAAGWLVVLARGRRARLPLDIATFLGEAIDRRDGRMRDGRLAFYTMTPHQWITIGDAARRRLDGRREAVHLPAPRRTAPVAGGYAESAAIPANASPH